MQPPKRDCANHRQHDHSSRDPLAKRLRRRWRRGRSFFPGNGRFENRDQAFRIAAANLLARCVLSDEAVRLAHRTDDFQRLPGALACLDGKSSGVLALIDGKGVVICDRSSFRGCHRRGRFRPGRRHTGRLCGGFRRRLRRRHVARKNLWDGLPGCSPFGRATFECRTAEWAIDGIIVQHGLTTRRTSGEIHALSDLRTENGRISSRGPAEIGVKFGRTAMVREELSSGYRRYVRPASAIPCLHAVDPMSRVAATSFYFGALRTSGRGYSEIGKPRSRSSCSRCQPRVMSSSCCATYVGSRLCLPNAPSQMTGGNRSSTMN